MPINILILCHCVIALYNYNTMKGYLQDCSSVFGLHAACLSEVVRFCGE